MANTMFQSWQKTGMVWEHYDPETGEGKGAQRFTGWSALVVRVMSMDDVPSTQAGDERLGSRATSTTLLLSPLVFCGVGLVMFVSAYQRRLRRKWSRRKWRYL
ncbi:putative mannosyl-oligosaccharide glucosidase [Pseudocercospora fuligena]|uniref:Mannosyl-oligosaccharide glucosidase n=1 Tax=Pseudocercospora fuligena TaxID=685502 RepID=A0A8H6VPW9_9PEZI|nr:putative mannosyl-oligosaccharide glucosidase [Pseudocercospora fuligena]